MTVERPSEPIADSNQPVEWPKIPRPLITAVLGSVSLIVIALSAWLAVKPGAEKAQTGLVHWFNDPPQPFAALFAVVNPFLRPIPLVVVALVLVAWLVWTTPGTAHRLEVVRALVVSLVVAEVVTQVLKHVANQPRPLNVIPGLDTHGYPVSPHGNAYPSAHTAVVVAAVCALWPWVRWPQRVAGLVFAVLTACNRLYIGAHWPIDVVGGVAIGMLAGITTWLIAVRWPIKFSERPRHVSGPSADEGNHSD
jgi:undecaprenyl-diphosphatase